MNSSRIDFFRVLRAFGNSQAATMRSLSDIELKPNDWQAIKQAGKVLREQFPVTQVLLFGSKARGADHPESDIDLLVLTSRPVTSSEKSSMIRALFDLELELDVVISPLIVAEKDWFEGLYQVLPIRYEIDRDGIVV